MLIGYVSDEQYLAVSGALIELQGNGYRVDVISNVRGAIYAAIPAGTYRVALNKEGYGGKTVTVALDPAQPHSFRLLRDGLLGYVWPKWVRAGESSEFRVHSPEAYKLELWRYGWEKELVYSLGWFDDHGPRCTIQTTPDGDYSQTGVQWNRDGYKSRWHQQNVVAPDRSGLYYFHAKTTAGRFFSFPWIVMPALPRASIAVLSSNITWNAYNNFGGRSNYVNQDGLPAAPVINARQDLKRFTEPGVWPFAVSGAPLSFDRPELFNMVPENAHITDSISGRLESCMAPAEWRFLGWLEREGFAYDLYSEIELHYGRIPLHKYKAVILNTHNEYFSKDMYSRLKAWVYSDSGKLVYLGGAGMQAEFDFENETSIRCRKELIAEQRAESAACLLGVEYSHEGFQSGAPFRVLEPSHWVFAGTGLEHGGLFGTQSLHERCPGGASAHELDKLSASSPANIQLLAKGENPGGSGADVVYYESESGGAVFSARSLCWTLSIAVDEGVSSITANVLRRFTS